MIKIGQIVSTYGREANLKVFPLTDDPKRFEDLEYVFLETPTGSEKLHIEKIDYQKNCLIISFKEITDLDMAKNLKNFYLVIPKETINDLPEGRYYIFDIIGLNVYENDVFLGVVEDVLQTGSNDVYVVKDGEKEILIPALKAVVKDIKLDEKKMLVELPEGLLD